MIESPRDLALLQDFEWREGVGWISSRAVAKHLNKRHGNVLRDIRKVKERCSDGGHSYYTTAFFEFNFERAYYTARNNCIQPHYLMRIDGLAVLLGSRVGRNPVDYREALAEHYYRERYRTQIQVP